MRKKIWFITGISSGLGQALAQTVIDKGDFVIGTFRNPSEAETFNLQYQGHAFALVLDLSKTCEIEAAARLITQTYGRIDFLVNNAGYGLAGAVEETSLEETKAIFEVNFFGVLYLTQLFLPIFRNQGHGHILQISSHGGFKAFAGFGIYNASKFALEGFSEALAQELAPLGVKVTIVEPGPFRTNFAGMGLKMSKSRIADYDATAGVFREKLKYVHGQQEGNPIKAAAAIYALSAMDHVPLRLPLGKVALLSLQNKLDSVKTDLENYREIAESVVF